VHPALRGLVINGSRQRTRCAGT